MKNTFKTFLAAVSLLLPVAAQADGLHGKTLTIDEPTILPANVVGFVSTPCDEIDGATGLDDLLTVAVTLASPPYASAGALEALYASLTLRQTGLFQDSSIEAFLRAELRFLFDCDVEPQPQP